MSSLFVFVSIGLELWMAVAEILGAKRIGRKSVVNSDGFRTPQVELLLGEDGWVQHTDNSIR